MNTRNILRSFDSYFPVVCLIASFAIIGIMLTISGSRNLSELENVLFQILILISGLTGSYIFGKRSANENAKELFKPHARSAFRRVLTLYQSLSRVSKAIHSQKDHGLNNETLIERIDAIVLEQLHSVDDALKDWEDIIPEEVNQILQGNNKSNCDG